jgi:MoxR-like ATPase
MNEERVVRMSTSSEAALDSAELRQRVQRFHTVRDAILGQVREVIVGQEEVLEQILTALFVGGHCLITGLPGTAKTLMVRTIAQTLGLAFRRIQFTPDLMPADITGTDIIEEDAGTGHRRWTFVPGPIFGNIILADEINRTPPKTQSALLEAMQELSCTVRGHHYELPKPFFVLATQNPIELEGTYPLPEAQLDRFLFNTLLGYLSAEEEVAVVDRTTATRVTQVAAVTDAAELLGFQDLVRRVPIGESIARYVVELVRATRFKNDSAPAVIKKYVNYGASVRAAQFIVLAGKARALSRRRYHVTYEDITALAIPVLRHRILLNFHAESDRIDADEILRQLLAHLPPPRGA